MTITDVYVVVTRLAILLTPIVLAAWWYEHRDGIKEAWRAYRQRNRDIRSARRWREMSVGSISLTAEQVSALRAGKAVGVIHNAAGEVTDSWISTPRLVRGGVELYPGTVDNPADPSPVPKRRPLEDQWAEERRAAAAVMGDDIDRHRRRRL